ncbi:MAG: hypothetical protein HY736_13880 [Verrucomicrobia bacterium]|nr:hypothetical protein [Verrucomicrobiota bacterium]
MHLQFNGFARAPSSRRGFTIVEVMMAACVMAFAITTSITTMQRAFLAIDGSRNITLAGQIMVSEMERTRMLAWTETSPTVGVGSFALSPTVETLSLPAGFSAFSSRFTLTREVFEDPDNANIRIIKLTISWRGYDGRALSRSCTTHYARYGIHDYLFNTT